MPPRLYHPVFFLFQEPFNIIKICYILISIPIVSYFAWNS